MPSEARPTIEQFIPRDMGKREWGQEILVAECDEYIGKLLLMRAGTKGGLQYHRRKVETFFLYSGEAIVRYDDGDGLRETVIGPGTSIHIPSGAVHQTEAVTDCVMFECSNPVFDDRVRMEEHYGIQDSSGLQTTEV